MLSSPFVTKEQKASISPLKLETIFFSKSDFHQFSYNIVARHCAKKLIKSLEQFLTYNVSDRLTEEQSSLNRTPIWSNNKNNNVTKLSKNTQSLNRKLKKVTPNEHRKLCSTENNEIQERFNHVLL